MLRLLSREESEHAACRLPVTPLSELLMHVDAQLGYPPPLPLGGPWPRAGAAAEARSVANCMLRMLMYRAGREMLVVTGEGRVCSEDARWKADQSAGGFLSPASRPGRSIFIPTSCPWVLEEAAEMGKRGERCHGSVPDGLGRGLEERDQTGSQAEKRAVWRRVCAVGAEEAEAVRRWRSESDAARLGTPPRPGSLSASPPSLIHFAPELFDY